MAQPTTTWSWTAAVRRPAANTKFASAPAKCCCAVSCWLVEDGLGGIWNHAGRCRWYQVHVDVSKLREHLDDSPISLDIVHREDDENLMACAADTLGQRQQPHVANAVELLD